MYEQEIITQKRIIKDNEGNWGVIILGTVGVLTIPIIVGFIILIIAIAWGWDRSAKVKEAKEQLKHLELLQATGVKS